LETRIELDCLSSPAVASNTNTKVVHWFTFQAVLMIAMCAFQIYYIKVCRTRSLAEPHL
jgi:hypothetical protein